MAKLIQVIETEERRGCGLNEDDVVRLVLQFFSTDGELLMERDTWLESHRRDCLARLTEAMDVLSAELKRPDPRLDIMEKGVMLAKAFLPDLRK